MTYDAATESASCAGAQKCVRLQDRRQENRMELVNQLDSRQKISLCFTYSPCPDYSNEKCLANGRKKKQAATPGLTKCVKAKNKLIQPW